MSVKPTNIPQCHLRQSADSAGNFSRHGKLGEVTENIRTFALPNKPRPYTFKMKFYYDSWNRIDSMTYPDGEVVSYGYNKGGMLENIRGNKNGDVRTYVESIRYNKFELKESEIYGNGTQMGYEYDSLLRLSHLYSWDSHGDTMQSIGYTYDYVGNITDIANSAVTLPNGLGGRYYSHYDYDPLYRLTGAYGDWNNNQLSYNLGMQYYGNGKIWSKQLYADVLDQGNVTVRNYNNRYYYGSSTSNTVTSVYDQTNHGWQSFSWDMAGNMVYHQDANGCGRTLCWDEENRLMSFADCENAGFYQYDAGGERTYKLTSDYVSQNIGGHWHTYQMLDNPTLYTSPYMVATPKGYTKHYYAESERVASRIGGGLDSVDMFIRNIEEFIDKPMVEISPLWTEEYHEEPFDEKRHHNLDHLYHAMECTGNVPSVVYECLIILHKYSDFPHHEYEPDCYWYHPDHLGSSSWITFSDGKAVQHLHYLPWGENFVDQRSTTWNAMYTFSAKEKDSETGYSYFGSRYYNSDLSIWLSVDPMSDKYASLSPYTYCADNPVKLVDPNGEDVVILNAPQGAGGYGHMAAVIQDEEGNWYYMTMGAAEDGNLSQVLSSGVGGGMTLESCGTKDMEEAIEFAKKDVNNSECTQELVLQTSSKMDGKIYQSALDKQSNVNSGNEEYKALTNSCADAVKDVLEKGLGIDLPSKIDPRPNSYFNKLLKNKNKIQSKINVLKDGEKSGTKSKHP